MPVKMKAIILAALIASAGAMVPFSKKQRLAPAEVASLPSAQVEGGGCKHPERADKLIPNDARVVRSSADIRGKTYHYMIGEPKSSSPVGTVFLFHGFPDLGFGWRYQVPYLMCLGYRVVVPDMLGYAGSSRPDDLHQFSMKSMSMDMRELASRVAGGEQIILGGHDWGGHLAWRMAMWHPDVAKGVFSVGTPFLPPTKHYLGMEDLVAAPYNMKHFAYILQFMGPKVEKAIRGKRKMGEFLNAMYGGLDARGEPGWRATTGAVLDRLHALSRSSLLSEDELHHYTNQFMRQEAPRLRGPLNWYRTHRIDWADEEELANKAVKVETPALFIAVSRDEALPPALSANMESYLPRLSRNEVRGAHWALWETSTQVNDMIGGWLSKNASIGG